MLIYGTGTKELATEKLYDPCDRCENHNCVSIVIIQKYAHVFWIPLFPTKKVVVSHCEKCGAEHEKKRFPDKIKVAYATIKLNTKTPIWTFSGLIVIAILIMWGIFSSRQKSAEEANFLNDPKIGDVYEFEIGPSQYSLLKVEEIYTDSVFVLTHEYETDKRRGLSDLSAKGDNGYGDEGFVFSKNDLKKMYKEGDIFGVVRK
jgi:hypothetical protein